MGGHRFFAGPQRDLNPQMSPFQELCARMGMTESQLIRAEILDPELKEVTRDSEILQKMEDPEFVTNLRKRILEAWGESKSPRDPYLSDVENAQRAVELALIEHIMSAGKGIQTLEQMPDLHLPELGRRLMRQVEEIQDLLTNLQTVRAAAKQ